MTPDEIKKMSDGELDLAVYREGQSTFMNYSTDLNAAWGLQYDEHGGRLDGVWFAAVELQGFESFPSDPRRCARLISEAYYYLKTKGE